MSDDKSTKLRHKLQHALNHIYGDVHGNSQLIDLLGKIEQHRSNWNIHLLNPYNSAYTEAYRRYQAKIQQHNKEVKEQEKALLDIIFFGLSLCGGSALTSVLGKLTIDKYLEEKTLDYICQHNMEKAFNVMATIKGSPVATFLVGQTLGQMTKWASNEVIGKFNEVNNIKGQIVIKSSEPRVVGIALKQMYDTSEAMVLKAFTQLSDPTHRLDKHKRKDILQTILNSPFCRSPIHPIYHDANELYNRILLSFYLKMVLRTAYKDTRLDGAAPLGTQRINALPHDKKFPPERKDASFLESLAYGGSVTTTVEFDDIGHGIAKDINDTYAAVRKSAFFQKAKHATIPKNTLASKKAYSPGPLVRDTRFWHGAYYKGFKHIEDVLNQLGDVTGMQVQKSAHQGHIILPKI